MKLGSTLFWLSVSVLLLVPAFSVRPANASGQTVAAKAAKRQNELTLAGVRPGRDSLKHATHLLSGPSYGDDGRATPMWIDQCQNRTLSADLDADNRIRVVRLEAGGGQFACAPPTVPTRWRTGQGLRIGDACGQTVALYGNPDSRSPSTKGGQPLELLYYAFDWAGPDVPQVMQVVCTPEKDGQPGRVVEITLAASSL